MKSSKVIAGVLFGVVLFSFPISAFAEKWPIKKFEVVEKIVVKTTDLGPLSVPENFGESATNIQNYLSSEQEYAIEAWLEQVAYYFESLGFNPPRYETKTSDGKHFEVHVYPYGEKNDGSAKAQTDCANDVVKTKIVVDPNRSFKNGQLTTKAYQDLAHELFHTVQYSYPMFQGNCGQGAWILEGTAEAVGIETARKLLNKRPYIYCQIGLRSYSAQLYTYKTGTPKDQPCGLSRAYQSQSLWHFLGEYQSIKGRPNPDVAKPPNYAYLHDFFITQHNSSNWKDEYIWLDKALNKKFGFGLSRAYPSFVGTFSAYWDKRLPLYAGYAEYFGSANATKRKKEWLNYVFGQCEDVLISQSESTQVLDFEINPVAARCLALDFDYSGLANFTMSAEGTGKRLADLAIAISGSEKVIQPIVSPNKKAPTKASFKISHIVDENKPTYIILSNVSNKPQNTTKQAPNLTFSLNLGSLNIRDPIKKPIEESEQGALEQAQSEEDVELATKELEHGFETQSFYVRAQRIDREPCEGHFEYRICGPATKISIALGDDASGVLHEAVQPTMSLERLSNVTGGLNDIGSENVIESLTSAYQLAGSEDGAGVNILIPQIEYGYTGTIDNAFISVDKKLEDDGKATGAYVSIGPAYQGACSAGGYYPYTGSVTILENTKQVLRGTYKAVLVDRSLDVTGECAPLIVAKNVNGMFSTPNPGIGKDEPEGELSEDLVEHTIQNINESIPGAYTGELGERARRIAKQKLEEKQARKSVIQQQDKTASIDIVCECNCETATTMLDNHPDCFRQCLPSYQHCENLNEIVSRSEYVRPSTEKEVGQIAQLREEFEELVKEKFPTPEMQTMMMKNFDDLPNISAKKQLVNSFKQGATQK